MRTIYKQALITHSATTEIMVPEGSSFLYVHEQDGYVTVWYLCDLSRSVVKRVLRVVGTGHPVPDGVLFLGTAFVNEYVWHVFEEQS